MSRNLVRKLFHVESVLAILAASLGALTLVWPDWIEALTGVDPDAHDGSAEWLIVTALFVVAAASALLARRHHALAARAISTATASGLEM